VDRDAGEPGQHPAGVDGVLTPAASAVVQRQRLGRGDVDPPQLPCDPAAGLVEVRHRRRLQLGADRGSEPLEPHGGGRQQRGQPAGGDRRTETVGHRLCCPVDRKVLTPQQMAPEGGHARPVTRRRGRLHRERCGGEAPAATHTLLGAVLDRT
jgi:hypothetical protein